MTQDQLLKNLSQQFNVIGFVDLADLIAAPNSAYKFFKSHHKSVYDHNDRIVIYSNSPISDSILKHLYQTANIIDISIWFVLLVTKDNITDQLKHACDQYSSDSIPFQNLQFDLVDSQPLVENFHLPETMCAIPWSNIEIKQTGTITPCCMSNGQFGNIQTDSLIDVFHGSQMQKLRQDLLSGHKPKVCQGCWDKEDQGLTSIRQHNIKRLRDPFMTKFLDDPQISYLDIKFNNTCNFKCRICAPESSSLIANERHKFLGIRIIPQNKWSEQDQFIDQFNQLLPNLTNIDMYGGEPFLIKKFSTVLKTAVEQGWSKNIRLHYNTNGSIWPGEFIEYWPHFQHVDIHFSIDAIGKQFELQRGSTWNEVESNILRIKNLNFSNMSFSVMPSISIMSIFDIDQVLDWANKHNFPVFVSHVTSPSHFSLSNLTREAKDLILNKYQNSNWPEIQHILKSINDHPDSDGRAFCEETLWYDSVRKENFAESHPEIAKAMGYVYNKDL